MAIGPWGQAGPQKIFNYTDLKINAHNYDPGISPSVIVNQCSFWLVSGRSSQTLRAKLEKLCITVETMESSCILLSLKILSAWVRVMVQSVKGLPWKHKSLTCIPRTHIKKARHSGAFWRSQCWGGREVDLWDMMVNLPSLLVNFQVN